MNSPFVRRKRLAREIRTLREAQGLNHGQLGDKAGFHRLKISRLETGERAPKVTDVMKILTALGVDGDKWHELIKIAEDASERGWWMNFTDMGARQRIYADLEAGATLIREYQIFVIPGLLQTPEYVRSRGICPQAYSHSPDYHERNIEARSVRQKMFQRPGGPKLEVILDGLAVHRLSAPPKIMADQIKALAETAEADPRVVVRILPIDARISGYEVSRSPFTLFSYPDPGDPIVAAIDTETVDLLFTQQHETAPYVRRFDRLRDAALSAARSIELMREAVARLTTKS